MVVGDITTEVGVIVGVATAIGTVLGLGIAWLRKTWFELKGQRRRASEEDFNSELKRRQAEYQFASAPYQAQLQKVEDELNEQRKEIEDFRKLSEEKVFQHMLRETECEKKYAALEARLQMLLEGRKS